MSTATTKCQARTHENKQCTFTASAKVGGNWFCGNHANLAKSTQLTDREQEEAPKAILAAGRALLDPSASFVLDSLRNLTALGMPDRVLVQILSEWKAGAL